MIGDREEGRTPQDSDRRRGLGRWSGSKRLGFGLLHTVLLMVVLGLLMSLAAILLGKSFQTYQATLTHFQSIHLLQQASDRFRSDVHQASSVEIDGGALKLNLPRRGQVVYALNGDYLERSAEGGSEDASAKQAWRMPSATRIDWELRDVEDESRRYPLLIATLRFRAISKSTNDSGDSKGIAIGAPQRVLGLGEVSWMARVGVESSAELPSDVSAATDEQPTTQEDASLEETTP